MTESLTERLRQRAASQTAEAETILKAELEAFERYQAAVDRRASQNSERYHRHEPAHQHGPDRAEMGQSVLVDRADFDLADRGWLVDLALNERERQQPRADELERLPDLHPRGPEVSDRANRQRTRELHPERPDGGLRSVAERE